MLMQRLTAGIWALLARHVEVGQSTWDGYRSWYKQQVIEAAQEGLGVPRPRRSIFALPLLSPYSPPAAMWTAFMMLIDLTYTAFWVPLVGRVLLCMHSDQHAGCFASLNGCRVPRSLLS